MKKILKFLGFEKREQAGSHEQWIRDDSGRRYKVTLDCPKAPFSQDLIEYMAAQAGVTKKRIYQVLELV